MKKTPRQRLACSDVNKSCFPLCSCSYSCSLVPRQRLRSRYCPCPCIQAIVWSTKLGTCNRTSYRLGIALVLVEGCSKTYQDRKCSYAMLYARHSFCCGPHSWKRPHVQKSRDIVGSTNAGLPDAASVRPASLQVRLGWSTASCRHVPTASAVSSNSARRNHPTIPLASSHRSYSPATAPLT